MNKSPDSDFQKGFVPRRHFLQWTGAGAVGLPALLGGYGGSAPALAAEPSAAGVQTLTIRVSYDAPVNFINDRTLKKWAETIKERSEGKITVQVYPAGQLFHDADAMQAMVTSRGASVQMVSTSAFYLEPYAIAAGVFELPYEFASAGQFENAFASSPGKLVSKRLADAGLIVIGDIIDLGPLIFVSAKKPLRTLSDLHGLKVRNLSGQITAETIAALGAGSVDIPFPQLPLALSQGTVDAAVATYLAWNAVLSDIANYAIDPQMWKVGYLQIVQRDWWNSLNVPTRSLISSSLSEAIKASWPVLNTMLTTAKQALASKGRQAVTLPASEQVAWKQATAGVVSKWEPKIGRDIVEGFRNAKA